MQKKQMKAISIFAGAGGCSLGFMYAGVDIIKAYENCDTAIETYNENFGQNKCLNVDLSTCDFKSIKEGLKLSRGELDLIIGGPPCQGFTTAGNRFWNDPRNKLVQNYANALECFSPRWFMMENVEGILTTAGGIYIAECIKKMIELGYSVYLKKVYMQEHGVPQRRKRVFIVGNREGKKFDFPVPLESATGAIYRSSRFTIKEAIGDLEDVEKPEIDHIFKKEVGIQFQRISTLQPGQSMKNLPEHLQHQSFKKRASRRVCDGTPTEKRGGAPSGLKRLVYDEPCLTITSASPNEFVHPVKDRNLTIRECARIQTFPDEFIFKGTEGQKIIQIGNAIPPVFAEQIASQIIKCDNNNPQEVEANLIYYDVTKAMAMSPALMKTCMLLDEIMTNRYSTIKMEG